MIRVPKLMLDIVTVAVVAPVWYLVVTYTFHQGFMLMPVRGVIDTSWAFICAMIFIGVVISTVMVSVAWIWNTVASLATYLDKAYKAKIKQDPSFSLWNLIGIVPYDPAEENRVLEEKEKYQFKKIDPKTGFSLDRSNIIDQDEIK